MDFWNTIEDLKKTCTDSFSIENQKLEIKNETRFRNEAIDKLVKNIVFGTNEEIKIIASNIIWEASFLLGSPSASIHDLYIARANNKWEAMTIPAINIRGFTYDIARTIFKTLKKSNSNTCLLEIAKSEIGYTKQPPKEYATVILAAAIKENYGSPVFIQGDHFQVNAKNFAKDPDQEISLLKNLIKDAIEAGFYNIDIDTSTLVDLSKPTIDEQQAPNYNTAAELTKHIRSLEPKGITISVGGEIGEVGGKNSTEEELIAFMTGFNKNLNSENNNLIGLSKLSIQTGTSHGGVVLPNGSIAKVKLDFDTLEKLGKIARENFKIGGVVQHGASTLHESAFDNFPARETLEVHLATAFQNIIYESTAFPKMLRDNIYKWLKENCANDVKGDFTEEQFYYKTRKKGFGPFKKELWSLSENTKMTIMGELTRVFDMMFNKLGIKNNKELVSKNINIKPVHRKI